MKPKNKTQEKILSLSKKLPKITAVQKAWAFKNCFPNWGYRTKKEYVCFECGHRWPNKGEENTCPECGSAFELLGTKARTCSGKEYAAILTVSNGYQVVRYFWVEKSCKVGKKAQYFWSEVVQLWYDSNGKETIIAKRTGMSYFYYDLWSFNSEMEIRNFHQRYRLFPFVYPRQKVIDIIKRNGFEKDCHPISFSDLFPAIITDCRAETLLKAKQMNLLGYYLVKGFNLDKYWPTVKICIRNNYIVSDVTNWQDMVDNLTVFGKDTRNPKYVCPENLQQAHDYWAKKRAEFRRKQTAEENAKKIREAEAQFQQEKEKFFDLLIKSKDIEITPLKSVQEFQIEGDVLHHCVFENKYYAKPESLILSAKKGEQRLETIEVNLESFDIRQSRGKFNQPTEYHDEIIKTVKKNIRKIKKVLELEVA
jgi:hypothetical protein